MNERDKQIIISALRQRIPYLEAWWLEARKAGDEKMALYWHNEYCDAKMILDRLLDGTL